MGYYSDTELYHSETYLGADYSDGLKHYKYIKRYKNRKGKWVYVYADKKTHNQIKSDQVIASMYRKEEKKYRETSDKYWDISNTVKDPKISENLKVKSMIYSSKSHSPKWKAWEHEISAGASMERHSVASLNAASDTIEKGKSAIAKVLSKITKNKKPKKEKKRNSNL